MRSIALDHEYGLYNEISGPNSHAWRGGVMVTRCFPVAKTVGSSPIRVGDIFF